MSLAVPEPEGHEPRMVRGVDWFTVDDSRSAAQKEAIREGYVWTTLRLRNAPGRHEPRERDDRSRPRQEDDTFHGQSY